MSISTSTIADYVAEIFKPRWWSIGSIGLHLVEDLFAFLWSSISNFLDINLIFAGSWISVHRKADAALGVVSRAFPSFRNSTLEMLARQQGQAIMIWRNTPACGVAET